VTSAISIVVGGRVRILGTNARLGRGDFLVAEADEYDRSFLELTPDVAVITNVEADHLDCYRDLEEIQDAFVQFANQVPFYGTVVACLDDPGVGAILPRVEKRIVTYGESPQAHIRARDVRLEASGTRFEVWDAELGLLGDVRLPLPGRHNVANALAAVAVGAELLIPFDVIARALAGFTGGWLDAVLMRGVEILLAFPYLLLALAIVAMLGPGVLNTTIAVGIWGVPAVTRIVRGSVLTLREAEYVGAARALGAPGRALLRRHILPNIMPGLIVYATLFMANAILLEAALSFLGLGVQPPTASWGLMVSTGRDVLLVAPHVATVPGLAIMLAVLAFNLVGDGLRDALDPRLR